MVSADVAVAGKTKLPLSVTFSTWPFVTTATGNCASGTTPLTWLTGSVPDKPPAVPGIPAIKGIRRGGNWLARCKRGKGGRAICPHGDFQPVGCAGEGAGAEVNQHGEQAVG